jgi:hypothetical protein
MRIPIAGRAAPVLAVLAAALVAACSGIGPLASATPREVVVPAFTATTCDELAQELGRTADVELLSVINGPDQVDGEAKSVLVGNMQAFLAIGVTEHARELGIIADCAMPAFLEQAESGFSDELRAKIGSAAYDANPVIDYQQWLLEFSDQLVDRGMGRG